MIWVQEALEICASYTLGRQEANPVLQRRRPDGDMQSASAIPKGCFLERFTTRFISLRTLLANHILPPSYLLFNNLIYIYIYIEIGKGTFLATVLCSMMIGLGERVCGLKVIFGWAIPWTFSHRSVHMGSHNKTMTTAMKPAHVTCTCIK
jgi:hypothetical protein